jgi:hypothetical protein
MGIARAPALRTRGMSRARSTKSISADARTPPRQTIAISTSRRGEATRGVRASPRRIAVALTLAVRSGPQKALRRDKKLAAPNERTPANIRARARRRRNRRPEKKALATPARPTPPPFASAPARPRLRAPKGGRSAINCGSCGKPAPLPALRHLCPKKRPVALTENSPPFRPTAITTRTCPPRSRLRRRTGNRHAHRPACLTCRLDQPL